MLVRPSYVLGGRGMETCYDETALRRYMIAATGASDLADAPVLIDRFLGEAVEVDVDVTPAEKLRPCIRFVDDLLVGAAPSGGL